MTSNVTGRVHERPRAPARFTLQRQSGACAACPWALALRVASLRAIRFFGSTVDRLEAFCGAMHDVSGGEALRVVLEERASARVTVVGAIATML